LGLMPDAPAQLQDAFINGGRYWCGRCIPLYPPVVSFPLVAVQPAATGAAGWQGAVTQQQKSVLEAIYLSPAAQSPELLKTLFAQKLVLLGTQAPAAEIRSRWVATLRFDPLPALQKLWPGLLAGKGAQTAEAGLSWTLNPPWRRCWRVPLACSACPINKRLRAPCLAFLVGAGDAVP
jgi:hypothetical protein